MSTTGDHPLTEEQITAFSKEMVGGDKVKCKADDFPQPSSVVNATLKPLFATTTTNRIWTVEGSFAVVPWVFSFTITMTIHRNADGELTIFNALRTSPALEAEILKLGSVTHIVKLGQFHGDADAYYRSAPQFMKEDGTRPKLWTLPGGSVAEGTEADCLLSDSNVPIRGAKLYELKPHACPEGLLSVPCGGEGGPLLVGCDALMHVTKPSTVWASFLFYVIGLSSSSFVSSENVPKPAPLWFKRTVSAFGKERVRAWYQDICQLEWDAFVGAHGGPAVKCDHQAMLHAVDEQLDTV
jgi:hypothetical protein